MHVVIVHGTDDRIVPIRASEEMNNRVTTMLPPNAKGDDDDDDNDNWLVFFSL